MVDHLLEEVRLHSVDDVEEVFTAWLLAHCVRIGEVFGDILVVLDLRPQRLDGQLIVLWDLDEDHFRLP